jgi:hypothetical protein
LLALKKEIRYLTGLKFILPGAMHQNEAAPAPL